MLTPWQNKLLNTFALKTYYESGSESFKWEVEAYEKLSNSPHITKYYGNFKHNKINYVIMEFADKGSLEVYFKNTAPPSKPEDIMAFWRSLFDITKALNLVHTHETREGGHIVNEVGFVVTYLHYFAPLLTITVGITISSQRTSSSLVTEGQVLVTNPNSS
jgi:serine/threonine protein kinase